MNGTKSGQNERNYPKNADIKIAADPESSRYKLNGEGKHGKFIANVPARSLEQAKELAADGHPEMEAGDFKEAELCEHDRAMRNSCVRCGRSWGEEA